MINVDHMYTFISRLTTIIMTRFGSLGFSDVDCLRILFLLVEMMYVSNHLLCFMLYVSIFTCSFFLSLFPNQPLFCDFLS